MRLTSHDRPGESRQGPGNGKGLVKGSITYLSSSGQRDARLGHWLRVHVRSVCYTRSVDFREMPPMLRPIRQRVLRAATITAFVVVCVLLARACTARASRSPFAWEVQGLQPVVMEMAWQAHVLYAASQDGMVYAMDPARSTVLWRRPLRPAVTTAPISAYGLLFVANSRGELVALDTLDGSTKWSASLKAPVRTAAACYRGTVFVGSDGGELTAFDALSGRSLWRAELPRPIAGISAGAGHVFAVTTGGVVVDLSASTGKEKWRHALGSACFSTPAADSERVYLACEDSKVRALRQADGGLAWTGQLGTGSRWRPVLAEQIVMVADNQRLHAFNTQTGRRLWSTGDLGLVMQPVLGGRAVWINNQEGRVWAFRLRDGRRVKRLRLPDEPASPLLFGDDQILLSTWDGRICGYQMR